jgi:hypothetical protein
VLELARFLPRTEKYAGVANANNTAGTTEIPMMAAAATPIAMNPPPPAVIIPLCTQIRRDLRIGWQHTPKLAAADRGSFATGSCWVKKLNFDDYSALC